MTAGAAVADRPANRVRRPGSRSAQPRPGARPGEPTTDQIAELLRARMHELPAAWQLQGERQYADFVCLSPFRKDGRPGAFRICVEGSHRGLIKDYATGETWGALRFTAQLWFRGDMGQAVRWAKGWLGLDGTDPDALRKTRAAQADVVRRDEQAEAKAERIRRAAQAIYLASSPAVLDTPVDAYLRARGVDLARLPFAERWFRGVRFHPELPNKESGRPWPAMVAAIVGGDGAFLGVHRTWLAPGPNGRWGKAPLDEPKLSLGRFRERSGLIRLWGGVRTDPETGELRRLPRWRDMKPGAEVDAAEGIEDALTVATMLPERRCVAGVSLDNLVSIVWPDAVSTVVVWRQNDPPGSPAARRMAALEANYRGQGKRVLFPTPPEGVKDVNELAQRAVGRAVERGAP